jgi:hypothetical protein
MFDPVEQYFPYIFTQAHAIRQLLAGDRSFVKQTICIVRRFLEIPERF